MADFTPTPPPNVAEIIEAFRARVAAGGDDHGLAAMRAKATERPFMQPGLFAGDFVTTTKEREGGQIALWDLMAR